MRARRDKVIRAGIAKNEAQARELFDRIAKNPAIIDLPGGVTSDPADRTRALVSASRTA